jgi:hypothetical protein
MKIVGAAFVFLHSIQSITKSIHADFVTQILKSIDDAFAMKIVVDIVVFLHSVQSITGKSIVDTS